MTNDQRRITKDERRRRNGIPEDEFPSWDWSFSLPRSAVGGKMGAEERRCSVCEIGIGNAVLEVVQGDITEQDTEAIVNAANNRLWMGAGVAGAIKRKAGIEIEQEAVQQGPIPVGEAVVTSGGRLRARYVIHAAGMGQDLRTDADRVEQATRNSLRRAEEKGLTSVAFPAIGTGVGGLPVRTCAARMIRAVADHLSATTCIQRVRFVLFDQPTYDIFRDELMKQSDA